ncbi:heavy metal translocating P-type ATPase [Spirillospora sp. NPDC050679]
MPATSTADSDGAAGSGGPPRAIPRDRAGAAARPAASTGLLARAWELGEVRWATAATALFAVGLAADLVGAPGALVWAVLLACYAAGGWEPGLAGLRALRGRTLDVDLLMVVAAIGAAAIGQVLDGALLIVIFAASGALEAVATARTADAVSGLLDLAPETATRLVGADREERVPAADLRVGDLVLVRPGERVPADGVVVEGTGEVDQATITGEPLPAPKTAGDRVFAGTGNGTGALRVRVDRPAHDTVVARIAALVEQASRTKAAAQLFIEKVEQRYSVAMVAATLALFAVPLALGAELRGTLLRAMTFMIVASPCALVLATMPPLLAAIANAGRHGVLVKSATVMERLGRTQVVAFDKTGTLTRGAPRLTGLRLLPGTGAPGTGPSEQRVLALAAAAEHPSQHPLGRAVVAAARERGLPLAAAHAFASTPGQGVRAEVEGQVVQVGAPARLVDDPAHPARAAAGELEASGHSAVVVVVDGVPAAVLALADEPRAEAGGAVAALSDLTGTPPVLLTGDNPAAARLLAARVGITDVRAGLLPEDKAAAVRDLQGSGDRRRGVLLVGDGVNDAPALATADVGVAMGRTGSDLALDTADAVVTRDDLSTVPAAIALSRRARRVVVANLTIAAAFIVGLSAWDLFGDLPLPLGVLGHEGSTVIVGLNGLRLLAPRAWRTAGRAAG